MRLCWSCVILVLTMNSRVRRFSRQYAVALHRYQLRQQEASRPNLAAPLREQQLNETQRQLNQLQQEQQLNRLQQELQLNHIEREHNPLRQEQLRELQLQQQMQSLQEQSRTKLMQQDLNRSR